MSALSNRIGNYHYADGAIARRTVQGTEYVIIIAGAYNAFGLIGPEHNGIAVLDDTNKRVVLDQDTPQQSGYHGPNIAQWARFEAIAKIMSNKDFTKYILTHPRSRLADA